MNLVNGASTTKLMFSNFLPSLSCMNPISAGNRFAKLPNSALSDLLHATKTCHAQKQPEFKLLTLKYLHPQVHA